MFYMDIINAVLYYMFYFIIKGNSNSIVASMWKWEVYPFNVFNLSLLITNTPAGGRMRNKN